MVEKAGVQTEHLPTWEAFEGRLQSLRAEFGDRLLFRGQSDYKLSLTTTLERAGCHGMSFLDYYDLIYRVKPAVETFTGVIWDVPDYSRAIIELFQNRDLLSLHLFPVPLYRYMVYLRHHGFPSPLLDWSHSPFIAVFFAFRDPITSTENRSVYAYCEMPQSFKADAVGEPIIHPFGPYVRSHRRHFRQQSDYTICGRLESEWRFYPHDTVFGGRRGTQDFLWKFDIPTSERVRVLRVLNDYGLNAYSLFDSEETLLETMWFREHILKSDSGK
jgi:FRG domain